MDYSKMTPVEFDEILYQLLAKTKAHEILNIPGIYEILAEEYNNEVLEYWESAQECIQPEDDD